MSPVLVLSRSEATAGSGFLTSSYQSWVVAEGFSYLSSARIKEEPLASPCSPQRDVGWDGPTTNPWWAAGDLGPGTGLSALLRGTEGPGCVSRVVGCIVLASWLGQGCNANPAPLRGTAVLISSAWALVELGQETEQRLKCCGFDLHVDLIYTSVETVNLVKRLFIKALNSPLRVWSLCVPWRYVIHKSLDSCQPSPCRRWK